MICHCQLILYFLLNFLFRFYEESVPRQHKHLKFKFSKMSSTMGTVEGRVDLAEMEKIYQCPVCLELPICKIYQCKEGHLICEDCFIKMQKERNLLENVFVKCPTCSTNISVPPIRCRTAEQVINEYKSN